MLNKEIPLLPEEEVIIHKTIRRPDKIILLHRRTTMPIEEDVSFIENRIDSAQKLIRATSSELEEIKKLISQPPKKSPVDMDKIIIDIRKRLNIAHELIKNCDPKSIENISEIDTLIDRHTDLESVTGYHQLSIDSKKAKQGFINNCICKHKRK